jgi:hypothetical protein
MTKFYRATAVVLKQKMIREAWLLQSEKMNYRQHNSYNKNMRLLGLAYPELDYPKRCHFC